MIWKREDTTNFEQVEIPLLRARKVIQLLEGLGFLFLNSDHFKMSLNYAVGKKSNIGRRMWN